MCVSLAYSQLDLDIAELFHCVCLSKHNETAQQYQDQAASRRGIRTHQCIYYYYQECMTELLSILYNTLLLLLYANDLLEFPPRKLLTTSDPSRCDLNTCPLEATRTVRRSNKSTNNSHLCDLYNRIQERRLIKS